jgi:hypothetical protein
MGGHHQVGDNHHIEQMLVRYMVAIMLEVAHVSRVVTANSTLPSVSARASQVRASVSRTKAR